MFCNATQKGWHIMWVGEKRHKVIFELLPSAVTFHSVFRARRRWRLPFFWLACKKVFLYLWQYSYCHCLTPQFNSTSPPDCIAPLWLLKWHPVFSFFLFLTQSFFTSFSFFPFYFFFYNSEKESVNKGVKVVQICFLSRPRFSLSCYCVAIWCLLHHLQFLVEFCSLFPKFVVSSHLPIRPLAT